MDALPVLRRHMDQLASFAGVSRQQAAATFTQQLSTGQPQAPVTLPLAELAAQLKSAARQAQQLTRHLEDAPPTAWALWGDVKLREQRALLFADGLRLQLLQRCNSEDSFEQQMELVLSLRGAREPLQALRNALPTRLRCVSYYADVFDDQPSSEMAELLQQLAAAAAERSQLLAGAEGACDAILPQHGFTGSEDDSEDGSSEHGEPAGPPSVASLSEGVTTPSRSAAPSSAAAEPGQAARLRQLLASPAPSPTSAQPGQAARLRQLLASSSTSAGSTVPPSGSSAQPAGSLAARPGAAALLCGSLSGHGGSSAALSGLAALSGFSSLLSGSLSPSPTDSLPASSARASGLAALLPASPARELPRGPPPLEPAGGQSYLVISLELRQKEAHLTGGSSVMCLDSLLVASGQRTVWQSVCRHRQPPTQPWAHPRTPTPEQPVVLKLVDSLDEVLNENHVLTVIRDSPPAGSDSGTAHQIIGGLGAGVALLLWPEELEMGAQEVMRRRGCDPEAAPEELVEQLLAHGRPALMTPLAALGTVVGL